MPADPDRQMVIVRLHSNTVAKLNALCGDKTQASGRIVHRSEIVSNLLDQAYAALPARARQAFDAAAKEREAAREAAVKDRAAARAANGAAKKKKKPAKRRVSQLRAG